MTNTPELARKRAALARKIKELAPHIDKLVAMLDETKVDLAFIALAGATVTNIASIG